MPGCAVLTHSTYAQHHQLRTTARSELHIATLITVEQHHQSMMAEATSKPNKDAMSRALGAAFLSHRVEELEKSVSTKPGAEGIRPRDRRSSRGGMRPQQQRDREHSSEREDRDRPPSKKDASVIVVDASVLVHALGQLKAWCRNGREEIVVVPLEALNTLDLLKKGTTPLAQRARAASRILEQQVGTNPRIKVQRDEAYVLWDAIPFPNDEQLTADPNADRKQPTPEWLRTTICCARWEYDHGPVVVVSEGNNSSSPADEPANNAVQTLPSSTLAQPPPVVVAVCLEASQLPDPAATATSPVPLPAPQPSKYEQRCAGTLVAHWANAAGIPVLECKTTPPPPPPGARHAPAHAPTARSPSDDEWRTGPGPPKINSSPARQKYGSVKAKGSGPFVADKTNVYGPGRGGGMMVERPVATTRMASVMSRPIRVLARGEKLDP